MARFFVVEGIVIRLSAVEAAVSVAPNMVDVFLNSGESVTLNKDDARILCKLLEEDTLA